MSSGSACATCIWAEAGLPPIVPRRDPDRRCVVSSRPSVKAYRVEPVDGEVRETPIDADYLESLTR